MFDIGFSELALLALIGLLVLGPERLPRVARTMGLYVRKARQAWASLKQSIESELEAEDLKNTIQQVKEETRAVADTLNQTIGVDEPDGEPAAKQQADQSTDPKHESD